MHSTIEYRTDEMALFTGADAPPSSPATATAAPAATQRSCWRSTPREARNRSTTQANAATMLAIQRRVPTLATALARAPAGPARANGVGVGGAPRRPGGRVGPHSALAGP